MVSNPNDLFFVRTSLNSVAMLASLKRALKVSSSPLAGFSVKS
jgi:hypothetical protein